MSAFDDREQAFEKKFKHDQDLQFKVEVRRNKLLGQWVADELLGMEGEAINAYAKEVVSADFEEPGADDVVRKIMSDIEAKGIDFSEHRLRNKLADFEGEAKNEIMNE